jgi:hypothetical protein
MAEIMAGGLGGGLDHEGAMQNLGLVSILDEYLVYSCSEWCGLHTYRHNSSVNNTRI